jgi:hypothetical protein
VSDVVDLGAVSPKSRGRPAGRGRAKRRQPPVRELRLPDQLLRASPELAGIGTALEAEAWASAWLGQAWVAAGLGERAPEGELCREVAGRASTRPHGLAAVAALRRVAPDAELALLDETVEVLSRDRTPPPWTGAPAPEPVRAWRAADVWESERVLFVEYGGAEPHTLTAQVIAVGGPTVAKLALLRPGAATTWADLRDDGEVPMPLAAAPPADVLGDMADALRFTTQLWPRQRGEDVVGLRALAWARARRHLDDWMPDRTLTEDERAQLVDEFLAAAADAGVADDVVLSLADLFLDYGEGYIDAGPLAWSPGEVALFLTDWLPRTAALDAGRRAALPGILRRWLGLVLRRRGVEPEWVAPVVEAVDTHLPAFTAAFDHRSA